MNKEILNKYIELIDKGYCDDCNELNCLGNFPHKDIAKNIKAILEENQELKKQLEEQDYTVIPNSDIKPTLDKYKKQQKEFIEWIEDKLCIANEVIDDKDEDEDVKGYVLARKFMTDVEHYYDKDSCDYKMFIQFKEWLEGLEC